MVMNSELEAVTLSLMCPIILGGNWKERGQPNTLASNNQLKIEVLERTSNASRISDII